MQMQCPSITGLETLVSTLQTLAENVEWLIIAERPCIWHFVEVKQEM